MKFPLPSLFILLFLIVPIGTLAQPTEHDSTDYGWVKLKINIPEFFVLINRDLEKHQLYHSGDSLFLPHGYQELTIIGESIHDYNTMVYVRTGQTTRKTILFPTFPKRPRSFFHALQNEINIRIFTDSESDIFIDGELVGRNYTELLLSAGKHKLQIVHPEKGKLTKSFNADFQSIKTIARYNERPFNFSPILKFIPGIGYFSQKRNTRAVITIATLASLGTGIFFQNNKHNEIRTKYDSVYKEYLLTTSSVQAVQYRTQAIKYLDEMDSINFKTRAFTLSALAVYAITTIDGFLKPRSGYKGPARVHAQMSSFNSTLYSEVKLKIEF